jgi:tetratricopeptide (TPR) repeat protein
VEYRLQNAPAISRSSFGRTLRVAGWILAAAALVEIGAATMAMMDRARHVPPLTIQIPPLNLTGDSGPPPLPAHEAATPSFGDPFASIVSSTPVPKTAALPASSAAPAASPATKPALTALTAPTPALAASTPAPGIASLPKPTPVPENEVVVPQFRLDGLLAEAIALRQRGDMSTAITRLREALALSPKNPEVISDLAETYEKMNLDDKALEQWRAIYDMGEAAGIYYQAADAKLKAAQLAQGATDGPTPAATNSEVDSNGFRQGSVLALVNLSTDEKPETSEGYKRFTLKIPVKRRPDSKIDVSNVIIQVFFYDQLGDDSIVRTNATVASHWNTLPADWIQEDIEILDVDYTQAPREPGKIEEGRHYYGYVVCVYYNKELQDQAADPVTLIKAYPPPLTLQDK